MLERELAVSNTNTSEELKSAFKSQYHAMLAMFKSVVEQCPDDLWVSTEYRNPFWRVAYHNLYFLHLYIMPEVKAFVAWKDHQTGIQDLDDYPAPPEIQELVEPPDRPPQTGKPYTKTQILEYRDYCERMIDQWVDALDLTSPNSGFSWYKVSKFEHQLVTVRHLQHHIAQLADRIRQAADTGIDWVGAKGRKPGGEE